jgi:GT2 family glycosyltransferase
MTIIGGKAHRWRGKKIRAIEYQDAACVTMPRRDSVILAPADVEEESFYKVTVVARNKGGNGKILIGFDDKISEGVYIVSSDFKGYSVNICTDDLGPIYNLKVHKPNDSTGSIVVKSIEYKKAQRPKSEEEVRLEKLERIQKEQFQKREKLGRIYAERYRTSKEKQTKRLIAERGNGVGEVTIIGGSGYRWKGKNIRSIFKHGTTCVVLQRAKSMVLVPVNIPSESNFGVNIRASGDSTIILNFFGGQKYDGPQSKIKVKSEQLIKYSTEIETPKFPPNTKMYLRVWIPSGNGSVSIKDIRYYKTKKNKSAVKRSAPRKLPIRRKKHKKTVEPGEFYNMKFKPYGVGNISDKVKKVLISEPSQVPMVSIITPTRNGVDLLKKCYDAIDKNTAYPNWEWIIGDSSSDDGTVEYIKGLKDQRIKLVERGTTDGSFSSINNELTKYASGEYYLFLNNDTEPQLFWLYRMMSKIHNNNKIGIVGAKLMYNKNSIQHAGIMFGPAGPGNIGSKMLKSFGGNKFAAIDRYYQAVTGACMLMRAEDFKNVDGFDPIYYFCYEDVDLCLKVGYNLKKKILYAADAIVYHRESVTQKKYKTGGKLQKDGIDVFKKRWKGTVVVDMPDFAKRPNRGVVKTDVSFVTCVNNLAQYRNYVVGSLFLNGTCKNYEIIPILNIGNRYSAAQALNIGIDKAKSDIIVLCHQDVVFYEGWVDLLFKRIEEINNKKWGVLGTAGITQRHKTIGVVYNMKGKMQWRQGIKKTIAEVQTVDEHCMIIRKNSGLKFDEQRFDGFHCYGPDICLTALNKNMKNYGILCPLIHDSGAGSLVSGKKEFMRLLQALADKWGKRFKAIRTTTSVIRKGKPRTFIKFRK